MTPQDYAPESATGLLDLLRAELSREPLPGSAGYRFRPDVGDTGSVQLVSGRLTSQGLAWILDAAALGSGGLRFTIAAREVDGLDAGWYEFREGVFLAVETTDEVPGDPATVFVSSDRKAVREGGVHLWRRALLATGAAGEVARSHAGAVGYSFEPAPGSIVNDRDLFLQAWAFAGGH